MLSTCTPHYRQKVASIVVALAFVFCSSILAKAEIPIQTATRKGPVGETVAKPVPPTAAPARPTHWVSLISLKTENWPDQVEAQGNIMPWQETRVGTEIGGLRLVSVLVNVGDIVKKGQVLARLNPASVEAELDAANAQLMEAQATLAQAVATLERAGRLAPSGGVSKQEMTMYETQQHTAEARVNAARAQVKTQQLKLDSATLIAPDDGVISSRSAAEGAIVGAGSELFRLIRQGRLEWRAEVKGETLLKLTVGQEVTVKSPLGTEVKGHVRHVSPTVDLTTRIGFAYVDLPSDANLMAGLAVSGTLALGKRKALILPSSAVRHEGDVYRVYKVNSDNKAVAAEVQIGRVKDDWVEITAGLDTHAQVIAKDVGSLKPGEPVDVREAHDEQKATQVSPKLEN